jgi:hypothetical protein
MIKRATGILAVATVTILSTAVTAMAQTTTYPPPASVEATGGTRGTGGTAFTGSSQIPVGTLILVALVIVGVAALFVARRRAARFSA